MYSKHNDFYSCPSIEKKIEYVKTNLSLLKNIGNKKQSEFRNLLNTVVDNFCELNSSHMQSSEILKFKKYLSATKYKKIFSYDSKNFLEQLFRNINSDSENCEILRKNFIDILKLTYDIYKFSNHKKNHESDFNSFINSFIIEKTQDTSTVSTEAFGFTLTQSKKQYLGMREIIEKAINEGIKKQLAVEIEEIVKQIETEAEIMKAEIERYNESTTKIEKISVKDTIKIHEPQIIEFESKLQIKKECKPCDNINHEDFSKKKYMNDDEHLNSAKDANTILKGNTERLVGVHEELIEKAAMIAH